MDSRLITTNCPVPDLGRDNWTGSVLAVPVSYYKNYYSITPVTVNLLRILTSTKHKGAVEQLRAIRDKVDRDAAKAKLPAFTPSGVFCGRKETDLMQHSGLLQFDIDFKDNQHINNYSSLKEKLRNIVHIAYCGLSVSGTGYWGLVPISNTNQHYGHFTALKNALEELRICIDPHCKDVSRLRGVSYDPDAYFNHQAIPLRLWHTPQPPITKNIVKSEGADHHQVEQCLAAIEQKGVDITAGYGAWFAIGCSLANTFGEGGRGYFHRVSRFHQGYSPRAADRQYSQCLRRRYSYTLATFFYYCRLFEVSPSSGH